METKEPTKDCAKATLAIKDAVEAIEGRWKLLILYALCSGPMRFKALSRAVPGITDKSLSKELKLMLEHKLIQRELSDPSSTIAEYSMTEHGMSLRNVLFALWDWGLAHRREVLDSK